MLTCPREGHWAHHLPPAQSGQVDLEPPILQATLLLQLHVSGLSKTRNTYRIGLQGRDMPQRTKVRLNLWIEAGLRLLRVRAVGVIKKCVSCCIRCTIINSAGALSIGPRWRRLRALKENEFSGRFIRTKSLKLALRTVQGSTLCYHHCRWKSELCPRTCPGHTLWGLFHMYSC